jgi:hypothetical protein
VLKNESDKIVEYSVQYDGAGTSSQYAACQLANSSDTSVCTITFSVTEKMTGPVYLYYQLDNFYQNHRRYVKSRSDAQLMGTILYADDTALADCEPLVYSGSKILSPCGLIANRCGARTRPPHPHPRHRRIMSAG